jgi:hypothetical protein
MLDRDLVLDAIEDAQRILAEHIEPGPRNRFRRRHDARSNQHRR